MDDARPLLLIEECSILELTSAVNWADLIKEYSDESAILGLPPPSVRIEMYKALGDKGAIRIWRAIHNGDLIGFVTVLAPINLHFGVQIAVCESLFVTVSRRKTGAGVKLIHLAENYSDSIGSPGLLISAPIGSILAEILLHSEDYVETNRVFFRKRRNG